MYKLDKVMTDLGVGREEGKCGKQKEPVSLAAGARNRCYFYYTKIYLPTETLPVEKNFIFSPMISSSRPKTGNPGAMIQSHV